MLEPKISIIIPVYNPGEYLKVCLDTIIHQTYSNFEVLAINDGSTDYSYKLLKEYAKNGFVFSIKKIKGPLLHVIWAWSKRQVIT